MTRFGRFDDVAREYVITRPDTPLPWINYLGSEEFFAIISNTAGGYSFFRDARLRRLTRYRYQAAPADIGARFLYLRDAATGAFWSPSWQPVRTELEDYRCRHGLGYTVIGSRTAGIETESLYLVPLGASLEIWRTRVTNHRADTARLSLFGAVEFCLWDAWDDQTNYQRNLSTGEVRVLDGVIYHTTEYRERRNHFAYFACSAEASGFDTQREEFLGPYRGWERPTVVEDGRSRNSIANGWSPIASHQVELELAPNETREIVFLLGYGENPPEAKFDPPGSTTARPPARPPGDRTLRAAWRDRRGARAAARSMGRAARRRAGHHTQRACRPDGERVEPLPMHGDVQPVPVRLVVRRRGSDAASGSAIRARTSWASCTWCPSVRVNGSSTWPRRSCRRAAPTTSTSRSRSEGTTRSGRGSTTTRSG